MNRKRKDIVFLHIRKELTYLSDGMNTNGCWLSDNILIFAFSSFRNIENENQMLLRNFYTSETRCHEVQAKWICSWIIVRKLHCMCCIRAYKKIESVHLFNYVREHPSDKKIKNTTYLGIVNLYIIDKFLPTYVIQSKIILMQTVCKKKSFRNDFPFYLYEIIQQT